MQKNAQERGLLNRLREKTNLTGKILENINPEFAEMMEKLRATDERIRAHAENSKDLVRAAKSHLNRRDYLSAATNISAFHERCRYIAAELQKFIGGVNFKHYKFLLDQFDDEQKEQLFGYNPTKEVSLADDIPNVVLASLKKQAGISDWWFGITDPIADVAHNLATGKGQAMRALEKRFSIAFLKDLKNNTAKMVEITQKFLQVLLAIFKQLAAALARRNVDQYVEAAKIFINRFSAPDGFHNKFVKYYETSIVPLKTQHEKLIEEARKIEEERAKKMEEGAAKQRAMPEPVETAPQTERTPAPSLSAEREEALSKLEEMQGKPEPEAENVPIPLTQTKPKVRIAEDMNFINKIASMNDVKPLLLEILAYSEKLEDIDADTSMKLLAIAEGIVEDYKTAGIFDLFKKEPEENKKEQSDPLR